VPVCLAAEDSGLAAALQATLSQHPAVRGKEAEVQAKGFAGDSARAQRLPSISGQVGQQQNDSQPTSFVRARQPLWAFGRIDSNIAYADADKVLEEADLLRVKRQLLEQTALAYAKVQGAQQRLLIARDNVQSLDNLHQRVQRRADGMLAAEVDVRLSQARLIQARAYQSRFASEVEVAKDELLSLTQTPVAVDTSVPQAAQQLPVEATLVAKAQEQSAEALIKTQQIALAEAAVAREKTASMPTLYLQNEYYISQPEFFNGSRNQVGLVLEGNIEGLGFATLGRSRSAESRLQAANDDLQSTRNDISRTVNSLISNRQLQAQLIDDQALSVKALADILASYQRQYEAGQKAWMDVLNIQREYSDQLQQQAQAHNEWLSYSLKLAAMTGNLDPVASALKDDR
jgi:adhesin transport system outer membrane protein